VTWGTLGGLETSEEIGQRGKGQRGVTLAGGGDSTQPEGVAMGMGGRHQAKMET
jgi:hypothetical protein